MNRFVLHLSICRAFATSALAALTALAAPASLAGQAPALTIELTTGRSVSVSIDDLRAMPRSRATTDQQGAKTTYEGVRLIDLLRRAGVDVGRAPLQGADITSVVVITAADGYQAVFALAELDPVDAQTRVLVADMREGRSLTADEGPLRLVSPGDRFPVRWLKRVVRVTVVPQPRVTR